MGQPKSALRLLHPSDNLDCHALQAMEKDPNNDHPLPAAGQDAREFVVKFNKQEEDFDRILKRYAI